jgi:hypothetical protein
MSKNDGDSPYIGFYFATLYKYGNTIQEIIILSKRIDTMKTLQFQAGVLDEDSRHLNYFRNSVLNFRLGKYDETIYYCSRPNFWLSNDLIQRSNPFLCNFKVVLDCYPHRQWCTQSDPLFVLHD